MKIKLYGALLAIILFTTFAVLNWKYKSIQYNPELVEANPIYSNLFELNNKIYDTFFKNKKTQPQTDQTFLIDIDEASVRELGRWPWSRDIIAKIWKNSLDYGVKVIANDIIFSEKSDVNSDKLLEKVYKENTTKIILGTFSEGKISYANPPYQDYCFVEIFSREGGKDIVTLNPHLAFDDTESAFDQIFFTNELSKIFDQIDQKTESDFLNQYRKSSISQLTHYQKNNLIAEKSAKLFSYCQRWLTEHDEYLQSIDLLQSYDNTLNRVTGFEQIKSITEKIVKFKNDIDPLLVPQYAYWLSNIDELQKSEDNIGFTASFNAEFDFDGVIRKYPLIYRTGNKTNLSFIPSLGLQSYLLSTGYQALFEPVIKNNIKMIGKVTIKDIEHDRDVMTLPVDSNGRLIINYYGRRNSIPYVSARDLFNNDNPNMKVWVRGKATEVRKAEWLKDKTAIIGPTATGIFDLRNTPVEKDLPGVETHLTVLANLFDQNFMRVPHDELKISLLILFFLSASFALVFLYSNLLMASLYLVVMNYLLYKIILHNFTRNLYFELLASTIIFTFATYIVFLIYIYFFETRKSQEIKNTFSRYVSKEIVNEILKNQDNLQLKGQKLKMTVFFSDIRSFTTLSEEMDPQELSTMLNHYFTPMSETIFGTNGTIDKFMGDAIMALFGAPINYPDHPKKACLAALKCIEQLKDINIDFKKRNWPEIKIGIGLNTGIMVAGNIGSDQIQSYTVIGDEVNLAQRLESLTKQYHAKILISENTYLDIKDDFIAREVDVVRVKGKNRPVKIYELLSVGQQHPDIDFLNEYHAILKLYYGQKFTEALIAFKALREKRPTDYLTELYIERCEYCIKNPIPENWDGVFDRRKN